MTWRETYEKWLNSPALSEEEWKELDAIRDDPKEIEDRFYAPLVFGTAGLRGIMGLGTNRMNIHVIRHATQAFAELIVAEGAETQQQVERLKAAGCDYVQGYFFAKPMPLDQFEEHWKAQNYAHVLPEEN